MLSLGACSHQGDSTTQESCCPRKRASDSGGLFAAFEQDEVRQHTVTEDALRACLHVWPFHASCSAADHRFTSQRADLPLEPVALVWRQFPDALQELSEGHSMILPLPPSSDKCCLT